MCSLCEFHIRFFLYYFIQMYSLQWVTCVILIFAASVHFSHKYLSYLYRCTIKIKFSYQNCWNILIFSYRKNIIFTGLLYSFLCTVYRVRYGENNTKIFSICDLIRNLRIYKKIMDVYEYIIHLFNTSISKKNYMSFL